jgi:methionyl-tRNA formyltransferase
LPRWRGAAPVHRAIEAGDTETGITIMQMDAGLDTGDMLMMHPMPISPADTSASLQDRLADLGGKLVVLALGKAQAGLLQGKPQPLQGVTYASKIEKHEAAIDWSQSAQVICRRVRAFNPFPGASTVLHGEVIKVWAARACPVEDGSQIALPGTIVAVADEGIAVAAMHSVVILTQLQRPGGRRLAVADFLRGFAVHTGARMELPVSADGEQAAPS